MADFFDDMKEILSTLYAASMDTPDLIPRLELYLNHYNGYGPVELYGKIVGTGNHDQNYEHNVRTIIGQSTRDPVTRSIDAANQIDPRGFLKRRDICAAIRALGLYADPAKAEQSSNSPINSKPPSPTTTIK